MKHSAFKVFTYIRHPISKFEAGWAQYIEHNEILNVTSIDTIRKWFIDILNNKYSMSTYALDHIYPMSGALFKFDVDILLPMESFSESWENIVVPTFGLNRNMYNAKLGYHKSSINHINNKNIYAYNNIKTDSKNNTRKLRSFRFDKLISYEKDSSQTSILRSFRQLFSSIKTKDPSLWLAMCRFILIDFVCFPQYQLPASCRQLQSEVDRGRSMLLNHKHGVNV